MLALVRDPKPNVSGNLLWHPPYLYPMDELIKGIEELRGKGYWMSLFPEEDGLAFNHEQSTAEEMFYELKRVFPWMKVKKDTGTEQLSLDEDLKKVQLVILPIERLLIYEPIYTEDFSIFPPGDFLLNNLNIKKLNGDNFTDQKDSSNLRDAITKLTEVSVDVFETFPLIVFYASEPDYNTFRSLPQTEDEYLIKEFSSRTESLMDIIRFFKGNYHVIEFLPSRPGIWSGRYSAALIYFLTEKKAHIICREVEFKNFIKGIGMEITNVTDITVNPLVYGHLGETGKIVKHALRLNSLIMETDDPTLKFTQIMTLFEYLAFPFEYKPAKLLKGKIGLHVASTRDKYHKFTHRFEELGAGLKNEAGERNGLRTSIMHLGMRLEDLIPSRCDRQKLFIELHGYTYSVILQMLIRSNTDWADFEAYREELKTNLGI